MDDTDAIAVLEATNHQHCPLSREHRQVLAIATHRAKKITNAAKVARFNGWTFGIFAFGTLICALFSVEALLLGIGLAIISRNEFRGQKLIRALDLNAPQNLAWNQIGLIVLLVVYSGWRIYISLTGANPYDQYLESNPELKPMLSEMGTLHTVVTVVVYSSMIVLSILFQGLNAWYYFSRQKLLQAYLSETPPWIIDLQQQVNHN